MACRRRALLLALITAASAFVRPVTHVRAARSIDVAAKKKRKGKPAAGGLQSLKVPQLKEKCRAAGLPVGGTKAVLIERLQLLGNIRCCRSGHWLRRGCLRKASTAL